MKEDKWQHFCMTGSIKVYLNYRAETDDGLQHLVQRHGYMMKQKEETACNAGLCRSDGTGDKEPSHGRI